MVRQIFFLPVALFALLVFSCSEEMSRIQGSPPGESQIADAVSPAAAALTSLTYTVGPSRTYKTLQDVADLLAPGDLVLLDGGATYPGAVAFENPGTATGRITIRGVPVNGSRPVISGGPKNGIEVNAAYYTLEGLEIAGAPKAGIGVYADQIEIRNCVIHDCVNGLLGWGSLTGSVLFEYSEIYRCGREATSGSATAHSVYMATDEIAHPGAVFRMQFCYVHDGMGGNHIKSRSGRNEIYYNWIEGATHHGFELVGADKADNKQVRENTLREDSDVAGNVIVVTPAGSGARIGGDGTGQTYGRYRFVNNTFILQGTSDAVRTYQGVGTIEMHNNVFYNKTSASGTSVIDDSNIRWSNGRQVKGSNNWIQTGTPLVPSEFTVTQSGTNPAFTDISTNNVTLTSASPLINSGNPSPQTFTTFPFSNPLFPPAYHPPLHTLLPVGTASPRPNNGIIDIGAYEF
jgi:hypothetical protein